MQYRALKNQIKRPVFFDYQVEKLFTDEPKSQINIQLSRMVKREDLVRLKRGVFMFPDAEVDELVLANLLYDPSYVSLESDLNIAGVIPDITANVTSVTLVTSKTISTIKGVFLYSKIDKELFFGFQKIFDVNSKMYYNLALPEKALLDLIYIRRLKSLDEYRVDRSELRKTYLNKFSKKFPNWVRKVINE